MRAEPWTGHGWGHIDASYPTGTWDDARTHVLDALIPAMIDQFAAMPKGELHRLALEAVKVSTAHGESFIYHDGTPEKIAAGGNAMAVQIAATAVLRLDGVTFGGRHWCAGSCAACQGGEAA